MKQILSIRFALSATLFILIVAASPALAVQISGDLTGPGFLAPSSGFVNLTNPTGRPECLFPVPANCIGSGNPSAGFTSLTNPTGRPECIVLLANCIGSGNPSAGFTSLTNPTGRPECILPLANCIGSGNPSAGFTSLTNPTGRPECIDPLANCIGSGNPSAGFTSLTNPTGIPTGIPTVNPLIPTTADIVASTFLGMTSAFHVDLPAALDIPATLGVVPPSLANQTITNPEPTTLLLFGSGLSGVFLIRRFAGRSAHSNRAGGV